jgi:thiol-disulfide isomerase/thioredoxin
MSTSAHSPNKNQASELRVAQWIDSDGNDREPVTLDELGSRLKIIYCFQHWCPGCHSAGFPSLQRLVPALEPLGVGFAVVQTVFEGFDQNTFERLRENQKRYGLELLFGHDAVGGQHSSVMEDYRTGGTPWFILINGEKEVVFSDFHINADRLIEYMQPKSV